MRWYIYIYACIFNIMRIIIDLQGYIVRSSLAHGGKKNPPSIFNL